MTPRLTSVAALATLLVTTGCGGPGKSYTVGLRDYPQDVVLGNQDKSTPAPVPTRRSGANPTGPGAPGLISPPLPFAPGTVPPPGPLPTLPQQPPPTCPTAPPLAGLDEPAQSDIKDAPLPGAYSYRQDGTWSYDKAHGTFPPTTTRVVTNVKHGPQSPGPTENGTTWDVVETSFGIDGSEVVTTSSYELLPTEVDLTRIQTVYQDGSVEDFQPQPAIAIIIYPVALYPGHVWEVQSVDPLNGIAVHYFAQITQHKPVIDVCGKLVEAYRVEILGPDSKPTAYEKGYVKRFVDHSYDIGGYYDIAPQYGALVVADEIDVSNGTTTVTNLPFASSRHDSILAVTPKAST